MVVEDFTCEGLPEAIKKRHSYGATDNIILDYRLRANGKQNLQSDIPQATGSIRRFVRVQAMAPIPKSMSS